MLQLFKEMKAPRVDGKPSNGKKHDADIVLDLKKDRPWYERGARKRYLSKEVSLRIKRLIDLVVCFALLPIVLPILGLCYIAVKLDTPGPFFFFQKRTGKGGKPIKVYKLRTMVKNAAELREQLMHLNELEPPDFKITNDPRVTRVGKFLRKTSLDELPQIFNVIKGDMTLVGPRPSSYNAHTYDLWHTARFELKPGITGLAQVCGRSELLLDEKLRYDIAYLRNMSPWLDIQILIRTIPVVFRGQGVK
jgi:lipopolysaccharide/colanic/teichoic acid biosynthesis glycosyltransferase